MVGAVGSFDPSIDLIHIAIASRFPGQFKEDMKKVGILISTVGSWTYELLRLT